MKIFASHLVSNDLEIGSGVEVLPLLPYSKLDTFVATHADMLISVIDNKIFCYGEYYNNNKEIFDEASELGYDVIKVSKECSEKYPNDIGLNVLIMGKHIFASLKNTATEILEYAKEKGYILVNVNQGYSGCSTLALTENDAITADKGIYDAIISSGKNATLISDKGIKLEGYNCGFIGGASCVINNCVYFFGNIKNHPDYSKIHEKIQSLNMHEKSISCGDVCDFGGAKVIFDKQYH